MLSSLYKLISGYIPERLKTNLDASIRSDQIGFITGRFVGEAVRATYDVLSCAKYQKWLGLLLLIDFEKAYDSLSFKSIKNVCFF